MSNCVSLSVSKSAARCIIHNFYCHRTLVGSSHCSYHVDIFQFDCRSLDLYPYGHQWFHWTYRRHEACAEIPSNRIGPDRYKAQHRSWHGCPSNQRQLHLGFQRKVREKRWDQRRKRQKIKARLSWSCWATGPETSFRLRYSKKSGYQH